MDYSNLVSQDDAVFAFVQARMCSKRLPGKSMKLLAGKPVLAWVVERASLIHPNVETIVLTGPLPENTPIKNWCESSHVKCFTGSEDDVLGRFTSAAEYYSARTIIRLTADNPLFDYDLACRLLVSHLLQGSDYSSSKEEFGSRLPIGVGVEIIGHKILKFINSMELDCNYREHLNEIILAAPENFNCMLIEEFNCMLIEEFGDYSCYNFTLDTLEDYARIEQWITKVIPDKTGDATYWRKVLGYLGGIDS